MRYVPPNGSLDSALHHRCSCSTSMEDHGSNIVLRMMSWEILRNKMGRTYHGEPGVGQSVEDWLGPALRHIFAVFLELVPGHFALEVDVCMETFHLFKKRESVTLT